MRVRRSLGRASSNLRIQRKDLRVVVEDFPAMNISNQIQRATRSFRTALRLTGYCIVEHVEYKTPYGDGRQDETLHGAVRPNAEIFEKKLQVGGNSIAWT
jgi:hypothetical protein